MVDGPVVEWLVLVIDPSPGLDARPGVDGVDGVKRWNGCGSSSRWMPGLSWFFLQIKTINQWDDSKLMIWS